MCRNWHPHAYPFCSFLSGITNLPSVIAYDSVMVGIHSIFLFVLCLSCWCEQYLKNFHARQLPVLERFALLISITVIWAYAHLLTASGAYRHRPDITQVNCRTDKANLISSAPWLVPKLAFNWLHNPCSLAHSQHA